MSKTIEKLVKTIKSRKGNDVKSSYTSFLLSKGNDHCLNKLKEEVTELEDAIKNKKLIYGGTKKAERKYIQVKDVAKACVLILKKKYPLKWF